MSVLEAEHAGMAFAVEQDVVRVFRVLRILRVGTHAVEGAVKVGGDRAFDLAINQLHLGAIDRAADAAARAEGHRLGGKMHAAHFARHCSGCCGTIGLPVTGWV